MPPPIFSPISIPMDPLCTAMAVDASAYKPATTSVRCDSESQLQFHVNWTPHASWLADHTKYLSVQIIYSLTPAVDAASWRTYVEEIDNGDGTNEFQIKSWKIYADATDLADRAPTFARPLTCKRATLQFLEVGTSASNGTVTATCAKQPI